MNGARHTHADRPGAAATGLASWYVPGHADGFGDRLLMFDNTSTPSLELLRLRHDLTDAAGFEQALRDRVQQLSAFRHDTFSTVRAVQHLDEGNTLALVSEHVPGQRLSETFDQRPRKGLSPAIVTWLLRELTPALAVLQNESGGMSHGALTPDRIVLTPEGRLCVVEHVLGSALLSLKRAPATLWRDFSIFAPADEQGFARLDAGTDVAQLAAVALSMLLARPIALQDFQHRVPALLDEFSEMVSSPGLLHHVSPLRQWLERALDVNGSGYRSAADAQYDVHQLPSHEDGVTAAVASPRLQLPAPPPYSRPVTGKSHDAEPSLRPALRSVPRPEESRLPAQDREPLEAFPSEVNELASPPPAMAAMTPAEPTFVRQRPALPGNAAEKTVPQLTPLPADTRIPRAPAPPSERGRSWLVAAMALAIVAQTAVIGILVTRHAPVNPTPVVIESSQPGDVVVVNGRDAGRTPLQLNVGDDIKSVLVKSSASAGVALTGTDTPSAKPDAVKGTTDVAPTRANFGGLRLKSPFEVKVFEGNEALGSSSGTITLSPGVHQLDLVNNELDYRGHETVTVKAGQVARVTTTPPEGLISINAQPWANVSIDKKDVGETPLANVKVALGEHELVFRHPTLGERRQTVVVKAGAPTRVSVKFDQ